MKTPDFCRAMTMASVIAALAGGTMESEACTRAVYLGPDSMIVTGRTMDWKEDPQSNIYFFPRSNIISVLIFFAVQSAFALGSVLFPKGSFVKTFVIVAIICILFFLVVTGTSMIFTPENNRPTPLTQEQFEIMISCIFSAIVLFNYIMAYYRFKEMEVINRW